MVWRGTHLMIALVVALLGVGAASIHFLARPHIFTLLFLSVSMALIESDRRASLEGTPRSRRIWWLVPLAVVWTNLHGGFLALIAVLGLTAAGLAAENVLAGSWKTRPWRDQSWNHVRRYLTLATVCSLATLINPYGWRLHQHVIAYLRSDWIRNVIQEFQSPSFRNENMLQFEALMLVGLMVALALFQRRRVVEGLWIVFWAHMALGSARHVPVFVTVAVPAIAFELSRWWSAWTAGAAKTSLAGIVNQIAADSTAGFRRTSVWPLAAVVTLIFLRAPVRWPRDFPDEIFPVKMVQQHAEVIAQGRVLTTDQWGDYLIYTNPQGKVFVDGRSDFYGPEVGNEYLGVLNGRWDWPQIMSKYGFTVALLPTENAITQLLKLSPDWRAVEDDGKRILLVHASPLVVAGGDATPEPRF
jgi:hypothetical protein